ncbi:MAG: phosphoribosylamine--glycine ligase [Acidimicrobiales bacterium]
MPAMTQRADAPGRRRLRSAVCPAVDRARPAQDVARRSACLTRQARRTYGEAMKSLVVGNGGREAALGTRMAEASILHAFMGHLNPTLCDLAKQSGGGIHVGDVCDGKTIAGYATDHSIDLALVSSDDPLAAGVVDHLLEAGIPTVGPTRAGAEIEWNKAFGRQVVDQIAPGANPAHAVARTPSEVALAISDIGEHGPVVVKPLGLTGGKGVKVVGPHLADNGEAAEYALEIIESKRHGGAVSIEERISAPEFTIQAMTDGRTIVFPPATYDYPYRFEGDRGPGTGGMGSCALPGGLLPFLSRQAYDAACGIVREVIAYLADAKRPFSGCLNAGFFADPGGVRVIEFNARFGDPEGINIMSLLEGNWTEALVAMAEGSLSDGMIPMADRASVVTYLVAPEYALGTSAGHRFSIDAERVRSNGADVLLSAAVERGPGSYETIGTSRAVAIVATGDTLAKARSVVAGAITAGVSGDLEWRSDIGIFPGERSPPQTVL